MKRANGLRGICAEFGRSRSLQLFQSECVREYQFFPTTGCRIVPHDNLTDRRIVRAHRIEVTMHSSYLRAFYSTKK
jgi:hypothetical protein